jgi:hypothetical protein
VYPTQDTGWGSKKWLEHGIYNNIKVITPEKKWNSDTIRLKLIDENKELDIRHRGFNQIGGYNSKYVTVETQKMILYLEVTPEELKTLKK